MKRILVILCILLLCTPAKAGGTNKPKIDYSTLSDEELINFANGNTQTSSKNPNTAQKQNFSKMSDIEIQMLWQEMVLRKLDDIEMDLYKIKQRLGIYD